MVVLFGDKFFTLEEVVRKSGYMRGTIYNLTNAGIISPPVRGLDNSVYPSQGLYKSSVLDELKFYQEQKLAGKTKREISDLIRTERDNHEPQLSLLETRG